MIVFLLLTATGLVLFSGFTFSKYLKAKSSLTELHRLSDENARQKKELAELTQKVSNFSQQLLQLKEFNQQIRTTATQVKKDQRPAGGQGGSDANVFASNYPLIQQHELLIRKLNKDLDSFQLEAALEKQTQDELQRFLLKQKSVLASTPSIWPTRGWVSSGFGYRRSPFTGAVEFHHGLDIVNDRGSSVVATADGVITSVRHEGSFGLLMTVNHGYGLTTRYAHLSASLKEPGDKVARGEKIAQVGSTGRSTGPHLHYEVIINGIPVNPDRYIMD
ncbi:MAG: M23 family metallopeptidase [Deltaproteobacteria bacterium]|nr:M23 family metallopeptidase [Deltaproteobacteria bacterium]